MRTLNEIEGKLEGMLEEVNEIENMIDLNEGETDFEEQREFAETERDHLYAKINLLRWVAE